MRTWYQFISVLLALASVALLWAWTLLLLSFSPQQPPRHVRPRRAVFHSFWRPNIDHDTATNIRLAVGDAHKDWDFAGYHRLAWRREGRRVILPRFFTVGERAARIPPAELAARWQVDEPGVYEIAYPYWALSTDLFPGLEVEVERDGRQADSDPAPITPDDD